ncbi:hypothetical protein HG531_010153 [Fusarium graminearum]|nr:hypothetical protein HG531_010153 [Fusarium graminearum]
MRFGENKQCRLSLGSNESLFAIYLTLKSSRVEGNGLEEDILDRFAEHLGKFTDADITTRVHRSRGIAVVSALIHLLKIVTVLNGVVDDFGGLFSNNVGLSSGLRFVAFDVEAFDENSVNRHQISRSNNNDDGDGNNNRNAFDPFDLRFTILVLSAKGLIQANCKTDNSSNR